MCLTACGAPAGDGPGAPSHFAVPHMAPDALGLTPVSATRSVGGRIEISAPSGWEIYPDPHHIWELENLKIADPGRYDDLKTILYHPVMRVFCRIRTEFDLGGVEEVLPDLATKADHLLWLEIHADDDLVLKGFTDRMRVHDRDAETPAPIYEARWVFERTDSAGAALGFGVTETGAHSYEHVLCYWLDGVRGAREMEILNAIRAHVRIDDPG